MLAMMAAWGPWSSTTRATGCRPTDKVSTQMNSPMASGGMSAAANMVRPRRQRARSRRTTAGQVICSTCAQPATRP